MEPRAQRGEWDPLPAVLHCVAGEVRGTCRGRMFGLGVHLRERRVLTRSLEAGQEQHTAAAGLQADRRRAQLHSG